METEYSDGLTSMSWVSGYGSTAHFPYYDVGDAGGCPTDYVGNQTCNGSNWDVDTVWRAAWHDTWAWPIPAIYNRNGASAAQWQALSIYAQAQGFPKINFFGTLSQVGACATVAIPDADCDSHKTDIPPSHSWSQLWTLLNADSSTAFTPSWSTDITHNNCFICS